MKGGTGPLVYPAGFLYVYSGLYWLSGLGQILPAQIMFALIYLATQVLRCYQTIGLTISKTERNDEAAAAGSCDGSLHPQPGGASLGPNFALPLQALAQHLPATAIQ